MSIAAVGGVRPHSHAQTVKPVQAAAVAGKDSDGDHDGTKPGAVDMKDVGRHLDAKL
jgi:acyl-CoA-binding protein